MRHLAAAAILLLAGLGRAAPQGRAPVDRYLVEGRVHLTLVYREDGTGGEAAWCDTVSGRRGSAPFTLRGGRIQVETRPGVFASGRLLPDVAVVLDTQPWGREDSRGGLGLPLD